MSEMRSIMKVALAFAYAAITAAYGPISNILLYFFIVNMPASDRKSPPTLLYFIVALTFTPYFLHPFLFLTPFVEFLSDGESFVWWPVLIDQTSASWLNIAHQFVEDKPISDRDMEGLLRFMSLYSVNTYCLSFLSIIVIANIDRFYSSFREQLDLLSGLKIYKNAPYALLIPVVVIVLFYSPQLNDEGYRRRAVTFETSVSILMFYLTFFIACIVRRNNEIRRSA